MTTQTNVSYWVPTKVQIGYIERLSFFIGDYIFRTKSLSKRTDKGFGTQYPVVKLTLKTKSYNMLQQERCVNTILVGHILSVRKFSISFRTKENMQNTLMELIYKISKYHHEIKITVCHKYFLKPLLLLLLHLL